MIETISKILTTDKTHGKSVVLKELENGCIICVSHKINSYGYLQLRHNGNLVYAHRLVYEHFNSPIPEGLCICHRCDNRACLNPQHFFLGTRADNNRDRDDKGRHVKLIGEDHGCAKLTAEKVFAIRQKYDTGLYTHRSLSRETGISKTQITRILNGKSWMHLDNSAQL